MKRASARRLDRTTIEPARRSRYHRFQEPDLMTGKESTSQHARSCGNRNGRHAGPDKRKVTSAPTPITDPYFVSVLRSRPEFQRTA
jgi:hypothetical protein